MENFIFLRSDFCSNIGPLHYRFREKVQITGLKYHYNNFWYKVVISDEERTEIQWWINNIDNASYHNVTPNKECVGINPSTFLLPVPGSRNSILNWVLKLSFLIERFYKLCILFSTLIKIIMTFRNKMMGSFV